VSAFHLATGNEEEASGQQQALQRRLAVGELDAIEVEDALAVGEHKRVQGQDLEHLQRGDQRAPALLYDVADCEQTRSVL